MLTEQQKSDVRRHLDYGIIGNNPSGGSLINYRFFQHHGLLEFRMLYLLPQEETILVGTGSQTSPISPNFQNPGDDLIYDGYLPICNFLEGQTAIATDDFDIKKAGSYESWDNELAKRISLYNYWRVRMADFLQLPMNPTKFNRAGRMRVVVN